jgi:hypothetical protein
MISASGAAVTFPGAKADSTGVRIRGPTVGEGSCVGVIVKVDTVGAQAVKIRIESRISRVGGSHFFIGIPQDDSKFIMYNPIYCR